MPTLRSSAPTDLPITLGEAKDHLRVLNTDTADDPSIHGYLATAMAILDGPEGILNRALVTQTLVFTFDRFPNVNAFSLPFPPLVSVTSITYVDNNGDTQTWATSKYRVLNAANPTVCGRVELAYGETWPTTRRIEQAITVTFQAGFGDATAVPEHYKHLIKVMVKEMFDNREPLEKSNVEQSPAYRGLLAQCIFPAVG